MIAGLPLSAWLLILAADGIGLAIVVRFYLRHRRRATPSDGPSRAPADGGAP